ncbi:MAG: hypothetical protein Kow0056_01220 [Coriobacteriia bacterium]
MRKSNLTRTAAAALLVFSLILQSAPAFALGSGATVPSGGARGSDGADTVEIADFASGSHTSAKAASAHSLPDEETLLVHFGDGDVTDEDIETLQDLGVEPEDVTVGRDGLALVKIEDGTEPGWMKDRLQARAQIDVAATGGVYSLFSETPDDDWYTTRGRWAWNPYRDADLEVFQRRYMGPQATFSHSLQFEPFWNEVTARPAAPVKVAVLDTGFTAPEGEASQGVFVPMGDYTKRNPITGEPTADVSDGNGHGTMVASTIAAAAGNGVGIAGAAGRLPVQVLIFKVLEDDGTSRPQGALDINEAIMDAVDAGAKVINLSFGDATADPDDMGDAFRPAIEYADAAGAVVVAAAGNGGLDYVVPPAAVPEVIAVGSIDCVQGTRSAFSNHGRGLDLVATGESVPVLAPGSGGVKVGYGTSFSAPLVSGAIAALASVFPDVDAATIARTLIDTADPYGSSHDFGAGKLDVLDAYAALADGAVSSTPALSRYAGSSRYDTAARISRASFPNGSDAAIIASGENWPDALSAGVLAGAIEGPVLLTQAASLSREARAELTRLAPETVYVIGGEKAIAPAVAAAVAGAVPGARVVRLAGRDRYATAARVAEEVISVTGTPERVVIASGLTYPDALAAVPAAVAGAWPILLTSDDSLPAATADAVRRSGAKSALIVGGPRAIGDTVAARLEAIGARTTRLAGPDRYITSRTVARWAVENGVLGDSELGVATGMSFPDALAGGPFMGALGAPLVLADSAGGDLADWVSGMGSVRRVHVFGGESVVPPAVAESIALALGL